MADKEYIERGAVEKFIAKGLNNPDKSKAYGYDAVEILAEVHYMNAADVVAVRRGEWNYDDSCNRCKKQILSNYMNFCPNCGADMRGEKK